MAGSVAWNGASSRMAAYSERQPMSGLCAINRLPGLSTRPCVSRTVKIGFSDPVTSNPCHGERLSTVSVALYYTGGVCRSSPFPWSMSFFHIELILPRERIPASGQPNI